MDNDPIYLQNNETLQLLYIECIDISLTRIERCSNERSGVGVSVDKEIECVCTSLSLIDPAPEMTRVVKNVDRVLSKLLQFRNPLASGGVVSFSPETIYSCIIGRSSPLLVQRFQDIEEFYQASQNEGVELSVMEASEDYWKNEFYQSMKHKQHFLERVMVGIYRQSCVHRLIYLFVVI